MIPCDYRRKDSYGDLTASSLIGLNKEFLLTYSSINKSFWVKVMEEYNNGNKNEWDSLVVLTVNCAANPLTMDDVHRIDRIVELFHETYSRVKVCGVLICPYATSTLHRIQKQLIQPMTDSICSNYEEKLREKILQSFMSSNIQNKSRSHTPMSWYTFVSQNMISAKKEHIRSLKKRRMKRSRLWRGLKDSLGSSKLQSDFDGNKSDTSDEEEGNFLLKEEDEQFQEEADEEEFDVLKKLLSCFVPPGMTLNELINLMLSNDPKKVRKAVRKSRKTANDRLPIFTEEVSTRQAQMEELTRIRREQQSASLLEKADSSLQALQSVSQQLIAETEEQRRREEENLMRAREKEAEAKLWSLGRWVREVTGVNALGRVIDEILSNGGGLDDGEHGERHGDIRDFDETPWIGGRKRRGGEVQGIVIGCEDDESMRAIIICLFGGALLMGENSIGCLGSLEEEEEEEEEDLGESDGQINRVFDVERVLLRLKKNPIKSREEVQKMLKRSQLVLGIENRIAIALGVLSEYEEEQLQIRGIEEDRDNLQNEFFEQSYLLQQHANNSKNNVRFNDNGMTNLDSTGSCSSLSVDLPPTQPSTPTDNLLSLASTIPTFRLKNGTPICIDLHYELVSRRVSSVRSACEDLLLHPQSLLSAKSQDLKFLVPLVRETAKLHDPSAFPLGKVISSFLRTDWTHHGARFIGAFDCELHANLEEESITKWKREFKGVKKDSEFTTLKFHVEGGFQTNKFTKPSLVELDTIKFCSVTTDAEEKENSVLENSLSAMEANDMNRLAVIFGKTVARRIMSNNQNINLLSSPINNAENDFFSSRFSLFFQKYIQQTRQQMISCIHIRNLLQTTPFHIAIKKQTSLNDTKKCIKSKNKLTLSSFKSSQPSSHIPFQKSQSPNGCEAQPILKSKTVQNLLQPLEIPVVATQRRAGPKAPSSSLIASHLRVNAVSHAFGLTPLSKNNFCLRYEKDYSNNNNNNAKGLQALEKHQTMPKLVIERRLQGRIPTWVRTLRETHQNSDDCTPQTEEEGDDYLVDELNKEECLTTSQSSLSTSNDSLPRLFKPEKEVSENGHEVLDSKAVVKSSWLVRQRSQLSSMLLFCKEVKQIELQELKIASEKLHALEKTNESDQTVILNSDPKINTKTLNISKTLIAGSELEHKKKHRENKQKKIVKFLLMPPSKLGNSKASLNKSKRTSLNNAANQQLNSHTLLNKNTPNEKNVHQGKARSPFIPFTDKNAVRDNLLKKENVNGYQQVVVKFPETPRSKAR